MRLLNRWFQVSIATELLISLYWFKLAVWTKYLATSQ